MSLSAKEEWARLKNCINVKHYIGSRSCKVIEDALEPRTASSKPAHKVPVKKAT